MNLLNLGYLKDWRSLLEKCGSPDCSGMAPCFITASDFWSSLHSLQEQTIDVAFAGIHSGTDVARIVRSYAVQIGADEARLDACRDYLWVRLNRDSCPTDLVFSLSADSGFAWDRFHN